MSAQDSPRRRTPASAAARPPVKTSVPLDVNTHAKLCAIAALRGVDRSALAAEFIRAGLRGVLVIDKRNGSDHSGDSDRQGPASGVNLDDQDAA